MSLGPGRSGRRNGPQVEQRNWTKGSKNTWATHNVLDKMPHTRVGKAKRSVPTMAFSRWARRARARLCPPYSPAQYDSNFETALLGWSATSRSVDSPEGSIPLPWQSRDYEIFILLGKPAPREGRPREVEFGVGASTHYRLVIADDHPLFRGALRQAVTGLVEPH